MKKYINYHSLSLASVLAMGLLGGLGAAGCTAPLTEMDVRLATQRLPQSFGNATGTLPPIACSAQVNLCASLPLNVSGLRVRCDMTRMQCVGDYSTLVY